MESGLAARGYVPSLAESYGLWQTQRRRADRLGKHALILVGNSRMQNDIDLDTLRRDTGLEPVQLAIGGASFLPVLQGLADDPDITGTVLINFEPDVLAQPATDDIAQDYQTDYRSHGRVPDFFQAEDWLADELHFHLRSYADGTRPLTALMRRVLRSDESQQIQSLGPDRQIRVDFSRVRDLKHYALLRAAHELKPPLTYASGASDAQLRTSFQQDIAGMEPAPAARFDDGVRLTVQLAAAITSRGGRVMFLVLPRSGMVADIDEKRYPRERFWQRFAASVPVSLHYADVPAFRAFTCPDDSHLDEHEQARFTSALVNDLYLQKATAP
jgi:signal transduction histidine kinase